MGYDYLKKKQGGKLMGMIKKLFGLDEEVQTAKQEAAIPARCTVTGEDFDIELGYEKGKLTMLEGKKTDSASYRYYPSSQSKGLKTIDLSNGLVTGKTYHCPVCGNKDIVRCGKCHRITCYDGKGTFRCAFCGNSGQVSGTMQSVDVYNHTGMKQDGMKPQSGMKYYPGNK